MFNVGGLVVLARSIRHGLVGAEYLELMFPYGGGSAGLFFSVFPQGVSFGLSVLVSPLGARSVPVGYIVSIRS